MPKTAVAGAAGVDAAAAAVCPLTERASKPRREKKGREREEKEVWVLKERDKDRVPVGVGDESRCLTSLAIFVKHLIFKP